LIVTAIFTGMRDSELRGLPWSAVDFEKRTITVRQRADEWGTIGMPKSAAGQREIPMSPTVFNTLREWKLACPKGELGPVFPNILGKVQRLSNLAGRVWRPLQQASSLGPTNSFSMNPFFLDRLLSLVARQIETISVKAFRVIAQKTEPGGGDCRKIVVVPEQSHLVSFNEVADSIGCCDHEVDVVSDDVILLLADIHPSDLAYQFLGDVHDNVVTPILLGGDPGLHYQNTVRIQMASEAGDCTM
jgi:hypothetical protein